MAVSRGSTVLTTLLAGRILPKLEDVLNILAFEERTVNSRNSHDSPEIHKIEGASESEI